MPKTPGKRHGNTPCGDSIIVQTNLRISGCSKRKYDRSQERSAGIRENTLVTAEIWLTKDLSQLSPSDLILLEICFKAYNFRRHVFFYRCPIAYLGGVAPLWKKTGFLYVCEYRQNYKKYKKMFQTKVIWLIMDFITVQLDFWKMQYFLIYPHPQPLLLRISKFL